MRFFTHLFGDSSFIVYYLRWLGYDLCEVEQTGSNFGTEVGHETPYLSTIGSGTMVADGLSIMNADFSSTSFRRVPGVDRAGTTSSGTTSPIRRRPDGRELPARDEGDDPARRGDPRGGGPARLAVLRDPAVGRAGQPVRPSQRPGTSCAAACAAKNWYNLRTMGVFLLGAVAARLPGHRVRAGRLRLLRRVRPAARWPSCSRSASWSPRSTSCWWSAASRGFRRLQPKYCSIYDPYFWRHERLWKVPGEAYLHMFDGTPFKNLIWRGLGVRIGKRVFDDGCYLTERTLTTIGDDVHAQRRQRRSSATRRRTARSSPTAPRSAPAAPSGSARWSTTA